MRDEGKRKVYIGSSNNISRRMREYENKTIINKELLEEVDKRNWEGFRIIVLLKEDDKEKRVIKEYEIIGRVNRLEGVELYNVFINKEDQEKYGERIRLVRGRRVSDETRKRMVRPGSGERLKEYWFKGGVDNINAKRVRVLDMITGEVQEVIQKEVPGVTGGSIRGVELALENKRIYKKRYELSYVGGEEGKKRKVTKGKGRDNPGGFKRGELNKN